MAWVEKESNALMELSAHLIYIYVGGQFVNKQFKSMQRCMQSESICVLSCTHIIIIINTLY